MKDIAKVAEGLAVPENYNKRVENDNSRMRHKFTSPDDNKQEHQEPNTLSEQLQDPQVDGENNPEEETSSNGKKRRKEVGKRNLLPIPNTAAASVRYGQSATETAATASSFLLNT